MTEKVIKDWYKSSASTGYNNCVEARVVTGAVEVRDSKDKEIPSARFRNTAWTAFIGQFDTV